MSEGADTKVLLDIFQRLGEIQGEQAAQRRELQAAATSRGYIREAIDGMKRQQADLENRVEVMEEDIGRFVDYMAAADEKEQRRLIREAERRGAVSALQTIWRASTWTGRVFGFLVLAFVAWAGGSLVTLARETLRAFLDGGAG